MAALPQDMEVGMVVPHRVLGGDTTWARSRGTEVDTAGPHSRDTEVDTAGPLSRGTTEG